MNYWKFCFSGVPSDADSPRRPTLTDYLQPSYSEAVDRSSHTSLLRENLFCLTRKRQGADPLVRKDQPHPELSA